MPEQTARYKPAGRLAGKKLKGFVLQLSRIAGIVEKMFIRLSGVATT